MSLRDRPFLIPCRSVIQDAISEEQETGEDVFLDINERRKLWEHVFRVLEDDLEKWECQLHPTTRSSSYRPRKSYLRVKNQLTSLYFSTMQMNELDLTDEGSGIILEEIFNFSDPFVKSKLQDLERIQNQLMPIFNTIFGSHRCSSTYESEGVPRFDRNVASLDLEKEKIVFYVTMLSHIQIQMTQFYFKIFDFKGKLKIREPKGGQKDDNDGLSNTFQRTEKTVVKIVILGDRNVGKKTILGKFLEQSTGGEVSTQMTSFPTFGILPKTRHRFEPPLSLIGEEKIDSGSCLIGQEIDRNEVFIEFIYTPGNFQTVKSIPNQIKRGWLASDGVLFSYSVDDEESMKNMIRIWMKEYDDLLGASNEPDSSSLTSKKPIPILIVGNKLDLDVDTKLKKNSLITQWRNKQDDRFFFRMFGVDFNEFLDDFTSGSDWDLNLKVFRQLFLEILFCWGQRKNQKRMRSIDEYFSFVDDKEDEEEEDLTNEDIIEMNKDHMIGEMKRLCCEIVIRMGEKYRMNENFKERAKRIEDLVMLSKKGMKLRVGRSVNCEKVKDEVVRDTCYFSEISCEKNTNWESFSEAFVSRVVSQKLIWEMKKERMGRLEVEEFLGCDYDVMSNILVDINKHFPDDDLGSCSGKNKKGCI